MPTANQIFSNSAARLLARYGESITVRNIVSVPNIAAGTVTQTITENAATARFSRFDDELINGETIRFEDVRAVIQFPVSGTIKAGDQVKRGTNTYLVVNVDMKVVSGSAIIWEAQLRLGQ